MQAHDPDRQARENLLGRFFKARLEQTWPRIEDGLTRYAAVFDLTLDEVKRVAHKAIEDFAGDKLDV